MDTIYKSARELLADLSARRVTAVDLLDAHVARHAAVHPKLNAVIRTDLDRARRDARAIDEARARGEAVGPLAGLPMTIKDGLDVEGLPAHSGNPLLTSRDANCVDAESVRRVRAAGAIIWGKTNVPYMLTDWQTFNSIYGTTNNPYDTTRTPGGSSGGAAAALAAGITPLEVGSDIGGSLRHPANFCGVFSCKPTWGRIPLAGHVPPRPGENQEIDLNVVGPMARTASDLRLLFRVLTNAETGTPVGDSHGLRVALWSEADGLVAGNDAKAAVARAGSALSEAGAIVATSSSPVDVNTLIVTYRDLLTDLTRNDLLDAPPVWLMRLLTPLFGVQRLLGAGPLSLAGYGLAISASPSRIMRAKSTRDELKVRVQQFFESCDLIVSPVMARGAIPHTHDGSVPTRTIDVDGRREPYTCFVHWISLATLLHLPAVVVPAGKSRDSLPIGVQLIGPWGSEERLFDAASALEQRLGGFQRPEL